MVERDRTITAEMAALIKGMIKRGDDQSDIAAYFMINGGRVSEINTGHAVIGRKFAAVEPAPPEALPPTNFPSAYQLMRAGHTVWAARVALEHTRQKIDVAIKALERAEIPT